MDSESILKPPISQALKSGRVRLEPGEEIGKHVTKDREEIIVVLKGEATMVMPGCEKKVSEGGTHFVEEDVEHNVRNDSDQPLEYIYTVTLFENN